MARINDLRGGRDNDPNFGSRMRGTGIYAHLIAQRFKGMIRRLGMGTRRGSQLDCGLFSVPASGLGGAAKEGSQLNLF
jgi:hypothetical protein